MKYEPGAKKPDLPFAIGDQGTNLPAQWMGSV
jgi:hypothetical protein